MSTQILVLALLDGISYAALLFLVAVGISLIFGVMRVLNIAHGSLYALGAFVTASLVGAITAAGFSPWLAYPAMVVAALAVGTIVGGAIEIGLIRRVLDRDQTLQLLVTFAAFMVLENLQRLIWGVQPYYVGDPLLILGNVTVGGVDYTAYQTILLPLVAVGALAGLRIFLRRTLAGRVILAVAEDREMAVAIGVNARRVFLLAFILGAGLAALGGALAAPTTSLLPGMGAEMVVLSFAVAATAGVGQIEGAALAALLIGLGRSLAVYLLPEAEGLVPYLLMVLVLLARPQGLFAPPAVRRI
jgi:branched-chain amino acid transport system permease protein